MIIPEVFLGVYQVSSWSYSTPSSNVPPPPPPPPPPPCRTDGLSSTVPIPPPPPPPVAPPLPGSGGSPTVIFNSGLAGKKIDKTFLTSGIIFSSPKASNVFVLISFVRICTFVQPLEGSKSTGLFTINVKLVLN